MDEELIEVDTRLLKDAEEENYEELQFTSDRTTLDEVDNIDDEESVASVYLALHVYYLQMLGVSTEPLRCKSYLDLLPSFLPINTVWLGQSTYRYSILPYLASAFSVNTQIAHSLPPTIEVLASAAYHEYGIPLSLGCTIFSNSFVLLSEGILALNVYPFEKLSDAQALKSQGYLAELLLNLITVSYRMRMQKITIVEFGYEAKNCMDLVVRSSRNKKLKLDRVYVNNPVFISRSFEKDHTTVTDIQVQSFTPFIIEGGRLELGTTSINIERFKLYDQQSLLLLSPKRSIKSISRLRNLNILEFTKSQFIEMSSSSSSTNYGKKKASMRGIEEEGGDDLRGYISHVYEEMSSLARSSIQLTEDAVSRLEGSMDKIEDSNKPNAEELATLIRDVKSLKGASAVWASLFYGAYSSLTSNQAAVEATSTVISPVVTTRLTKLSEEEYRLNEETEEQYTRPVRKAKVPPSLSSKEKGDSMIVVKGKEEKEGATEEEEEEAPLGDIATSLAAEMKGEEEEAHFSSASGEDEEAMLTGAFKMFGLSSGGPSSSSSKSPKRKIPPSIASPSPLPSTSIRSVSQRFRSVPPSLRSISEGSRNDEVTGRAAIQGPSISPATDRKRPVPPSLRSNKE